MNNFSFEDFEAQSKARFDKDMADLEAKMEGHRRYQEKLYRDMPEKDQIYFDMAGASREIVNELFDDLKADRIDPGMPKRIRVCAKFKNGEYQRTCACWGLDDEEMEEDAKPAR